MYTDENYLWGLVAYYLGVLLLLVPTWRLTRVLPGFPLRALVRCGALAVLGTPMLAYSDMYHLAPAWGVMLFDAISPAQSDGLLRGVLPLLAVFGLLYAISLLFWLLPLRRRRWPSRAAQTHRRAAQAHRREPGFGDVHGHAPRPNAD